jgi:hypothetical protein
MVVDNYHRILGVDKRYLANEPYQNDPAYIAKIILIDQARQNLGLKSLDSPPFFLEKHLNYFRDKYS